MASPAGCAGFFRRHGFAFDVGATTLVDFEPGGVGGKLLADIGMAPLEGEVLAGYIAWLSDRRPGSGTPSILVRIIRAEVPDAMANANSSGDSGVRRSLSHCYQVMRRVNYLKEGQAIMRHIVLTAEQAQVVLQAGEPVEVRDHQGRTVAHLSPLDPAHLSIGTQS
jgi:hypothetical protein